MKKTISLLLALLMCAMLIPASAFAANEPLKTVTVEKTNVKATSVFNTGGYGSFRTVETWEEDGYVEVVTLEYGLMDSNGKVIIPAITEGGEYNGDKAIYYCNGVFVDPVTVGIYSDDYGYSEYINIYDKSGKKIANAVDYIKAYGEKTYGPSVNCYMMDVSCINNNLIMNVIFAGPVEDASDIYMEEYLKLVLDPAAGKVIYATRTFNPEEMGLAEATRYNFGAYSEGLLNYMAYRYDIPTDSTVILQSGYIDANGKMVINLGSKYDDTWPMYNGLAAVRGSNEKIGFIDKAGKEVIPCIYDEAGFFDLSEYAYAEKNGKLGYIDKTGKEVIPFEYDSAYGGAEGLFTVKKNGKFGAVDKNNTVVVPFEYDDISHPENGVMYAIKDGVVYVIKYADNAAATTQPETPAATNVKEKFGDVPATAWYGPFLQKAFDNGIVGGMSADKFGPDSNLTNAQIMVMVANLHAMQKGEKIDLAALSDGTHWASAFRNYCKAEGIIDGRFDSKMDAKVNRGEMAYYFANAISAKSYADKNEANFSDVNGNAYAAEITKLAKAGIVGGFSDGTFKADQLVTRAQSCVFVSNLIDAMGE